MTLKSLRAGCLCSVICAAVICGRSAPAAADYFAVIAACSRYENTAFNIPKFPALPFSDSRLLVLHDALLQTPNWSENNIIVLLNDNATRAHILSALEDMAGRVGPEDYFLFSWSGHGTQVPDSDGDESWLDASDTADEAICPHDIARASGTLANVITDDELDRYLSAIACRGMTLVFDCCLSGGMADIGSATAAASFAGRFSRRMQKAQPGDVNGGNRVVLMSTRPDFLERGIFLTGFPLVTGLAFACRHPELSDKKGDSVLSAEELFRVARPMVYLQSSLIWFGVWTTAFAGYHGSAGASLRAAVDTVIAYGAAQLVAKCMYGQYMVNFPVMADEYSGELPLVERWLQ